MPGAEGARGAHGSCGHWVWGLGHRERPLAQVGTQMHEQIVWFPLLLWFPMRSKFPCGGGAPASSEKPPDPGTHSCTRAYTGRQSESEQRKSASSQEGSLPTMQEKTHSRKTICRLTPHWKMQGRETGVLGFPTAFPGSEPCQARNVLSSLSREGLGVSIIHTSV